jgi:hypothetical protein
MNRVVSAGEIQGKAKVEQLLGDVVRTLARSRLSGAIRSVDARLLSRSPEELLAIRPTSNGAWECEFRPMVELLLREILAISSRDDESADAREREIAGVMTLAGY